jgi:Cation transporter/ATPase, N-terminus
MLTQRLGQVERNIYKSGGRIGGLGTTRNLRSQRHSPLEFLDRIRHRGRIVTRVYIALAAILLTVTRLLSRTSMSDSPKSGEPLQVGDEQVTREELLVAGKSNKQETVVVTPMEDARQDENAPSEALDEPVDSGAPPAAGRSVAFPPVEVDSGIEEKPTGLDRPRGVEMRRELTKEERDLAQAGYDHLEEQEDAIANKGEDEMDKVDIHEHRLKFDELENALETNMITKEPSLSRGLELDEAATRLARDGRNVLTPPKKKSAFRKVSFTILEADTLSKTYLSISTVC